MTGIIMRVLFIGNSFTYYNNMPQIVRRLSESFEEPGRPVLEVSMETVGGQTLSFHWTRDETRAALGSGTWDVVVLQEHSRQMSNIEGFKTSCGSFVEEARFENPDSRVLLYLLWRHYEEVMPDKLAVYRDIARETGAEIAPVAYAWERMKEERGWAHSRDGFHPGEEASFLIACVFYAAITGLNPEGAGSFPIWSTDEEKEIELDADARNYLERLAWETVQDFGTR